VHSWSFCSLVDFLFCFCLGDDYGDGGAGIVIVVMVVFFL
jgi:hypothetical protein